MSCLESMDSGMESAAQSGMEAWNPPCSLPCTQACMQSGMDSGVEQGMESVPRKHRCPRGFSLLQLAVISVLQSCRSVITYWRIAQLVSSGYGLQITAGAARGVADRLVRRGVLRRNRAAEGLLHGNVYALSGVICPCIQPYRPRMESGVDSAAQFGTQPVHSILRSEKTDRKDLSVSSENGERQKLEALTEGDIAFHWPQLAKQGFGTDQIRQIIRRLTQINIKPEKVIQGLGHAEWEFSAGKMRDKSGKLVGSPVNWVFKILASQGYYPRPDGYVSPQEQAELDAAEEAKRMTEALKAREEAEAEAWIAGLSYEEKQAIMKVEKGGFSMPDDIALSLYFRKKILPHRQQKGAS